MHGIIWLFTQTLKQTPNCVAWIVSGMTAALWFNSLWLRSYRVTSKRKWWLQKLQINLSEEQNNASVCGKHFPDECFKLTPTGKRTLRPDAFPVSNMIGLYLCNDSSPHFKAANLPEWRPTQTVTAKHVHGCKLALFSTSPILCTELMTK